MLWLADRVEDQLQAYLVARHHQRWETRERVLVGISGAPGERLIRRAARIAGRVHGDLVGVHIVPADGLARKTGDELGYQRDLLDELGGTFHEAVGDDVAATLAAVANAERTTQLVIGTSRRSRRPRSSGARRSARSSGDWMRPGRARHLDPPDDDDHTPTCCRPVRRVSARLPLPRDDASRRWTVLVIGLPLVTLLLIPYRDDLAWRRCCC